MARVRTHPGRVLREEVRTRGMSANQIALAIRVPANRLTAILRGDRAFPRIRPCAWGDTSAPDLNSG